MMSFFPSFNIHGDAESGARLTDDDDGDGHVCVLVCVSM